MWLTLPWLTLQGSLLGRGATTANHPIQPQGCPSATDVVDPSVVDPSQGSLLGRGATTANHPIQPQGCPSATDVVDPSVVDPAQESLLGRGASRANHPIQPQGCPSQGKRTTHLLQQSPFLKGVPATEAALTVFSDNPSRKTTNPALGVNSV